MLLRAKMLCAYALTAAVAALLGGVANENLPDDAEQSAAVADATPADIPEGWVVKEMQVRVPVVVPADAPFGLLLDGDETPPAKMPIPKHLSMPVPPWVPKGMVPQFPPQINPFAALPFDAEPAAADRGTLKTRDRVIDDGDGGLALVRERRWTTDGVAHQDVEYRSLDDLPRVDASSADTPDDSDDEETTGTRRKGFSVYSSIRGKPGETVGVGITADSSEGVRVYRYRDGSAR